MNVSVASIARSIVPPVTGKSSNAHLFGSARASYDRARVTGRNRLVLLASVAALALTLPASSPSAATRVFRAALVTDVYSADPHSVRGAIIVAFDQAVKRFHVQGRIVEYNVRAGQVPTLTSLAQQGYDLVFVSVFDAVSDARTFADFAPRFPHTTFAMPEIPYAFLAASHAKNGHPKNVLGTDWRVQEPAYLAGYLAALEEQRRAGGHIVGSVGGCRCPGIVLPFQDGFDAGAHKADPAITSLRSYSNDFQDQTKCRKAALGEISRGAGVVFNVAGICGLGTLAAAKQKGVWGVGVDVDQSFLGPHILTSVVKRYDIYVNRMIRSLVDGKLGGGGDIVEDLNDGGVGLGALSRKVPAAFVRQIERIRAEIAAGTIRVPN